MTKLSPRAKPIRLTATQSELGCGRGCTSHNISSRDAYASRHGESFRIFEYYLFFSKAVYCIAMNSRILFDEQFEEIAAPSIKTFSRRPTKERAPWRGSLRSRTET